MVKITLIGHEVKLRLVASNEIKDIVIVNGDYNNKTFLYLIKTDKTVYLESTEGIGLLCSSVNAMYVSMLTVMDRIVKIKNDDNIYIEGINDIPDDEAKNILLNMI